MKNRRFLVFLVFLLIFCTNKSLAQERQKIDSLKRLLNENPADSSRINIYSRLTSNYAFTRTKLDTAKLYADSVKLISIKIDDKSGIAVSHYWYGVIDRFEGNYHQGLKQMKKYVEFRQQKGDSSLVAEGLYHMGTMNYYLGNYKESLIAYQRVLSIFRNNKDTKGVANLLHSMAHIQRKLKQHEKAIKNYKESIAIKEKLNNLTGLSMSTESLGNTYGELKQYNQAEFYLLKALDIVKKQERSYGIASVTENLGNLYGRMGNYQKSLKYHLESLEIREELPSKKNLTTSLTKVGYLYNKIGKSNLAENYLKKSLNIAKENGFKPVLEQNYKALSEFYVEKQDYKKAFQYQKLYTDIKDSILNVENNKQLLELQTKYESTQKDQEITLLTKENEIKEKEVQRQDDIKKAILIGLFLTLLFAGLLFYTLRQKLKNQKLLTAKNEEIKISHLKEQLGTLEMKALRAQMNPHFLFNCMNSINTMIIRDDNANASKYLTKFSKLVRLMLENSENPKVTLKDELDMLRSYIQLESIRFKNKMDYKINVAESIDKESTFLPSMVLQPFVENAIWHGLLHKESKGLLTIDITEEDDYLHCSITDNGVGREKSLKLQKQSGFKKKSMGIKITTDRLKLLTRQKINEVIKIIDLKDHENNVMGTQVDILIPIS